MTYHGIGVHWGTSSSTIGTISGALQTRDHSYKQDKEEIKDGNGQVQGLVYYNPVEEANFNAILTQSSLNGTLTPSLPTIGNMITITDTVYTLLAGTTWIVDSVDTKSANNQAMRMDLKLIRYSGVST